MKKMTIAILCIAALQINAQTKTETKNYNELFTKGTSVLQFNLGLGGSLGLPIQVSYEQGITNNIGVGAIVGFAGKTIKTGIYDYKYTYLLFGARANYHKQFIDKLDTYAGLTLGLNAASVKVTPAFIGTSVAGGGMFLAGQLGGRYYFTDKVAASLELGYGIGYANLGIAYKLK
jgi:hypothetical protein